MSYPPPSFAGMSPSYPLPGFAGGGQGGEQRLAGSKCCLLTLRALSPHPALPPALRGEGKTRSSSTRSNRPSATSDREMADRSTPVRSNFRDRLRSARPIAHLSIPLDLPVPHA